MSDTKFIRISWFLLISILLLIQPSYFAAAEASSISTGSSSCSKPLNLAADYLLDTQLFANATRLKLPASIKLPYLSAVKIVNIKVTGLDKANRGCDLELSVPSRSQLQLKACASLENLHISFMLKAASFPVDFVTAIIKDVNARFVAVVNVVPNGRIELIELNIGFGHIKVQNTGISGSVISKIISMNSVKEKIRETVQDQVRGQIEENLRQLKLPQ